MLRILLLTSLLSTVYMTGCQESRDSLDHPSPPRHSLHLEGELQLHGEVSWVDSTDELKTTIWAVNTGSDTAAIKTGYCAFIVLAFTPSEEDRELVWYNKMPDKYICTDEMLVYRIPPKDTLQLNDQLYISGNNWHWSIPQGKWNFVLEAKTEEGQSIKANANTVQIK